MARPRSAYPTFKLAQRGGKWVIEYWWQGRSWRVSTGAQDAVGARRALVQYEAGWNTPEPPTNPTLGVILDGYLADRTRPREDGGVASPASLEFACRALKRHLGDLEPAHLTVERCRTYAKKRKLEGYEVGPKDNRRTKLVGAGTILKELNTLRAALRWGVGATWIASAPYVEVPAAPPARDRWLTRGEAARLLHNAQEFHVRLFLLLALHTAARAGAILTLRWEAVDLARRRIDYGTGVGNKGRARSVPISDELLAALEDAQQLATTEWVVEYGGSSVKSVKTGFRATCKRADLVGVTPHTLRHTAATWMAQAGVPLWDIAGFLGHKDMAMMQRVYGHHCPDHLRTASGAIGRVSTSSGEKTRKPRKGKTQ